ncbi:hypothetical protein [Planctomicrobium sp. SH664]|uniref:hypothetical protein n=1 Tax=Planctomicrobium sp. SH664 TaxID=3448125 RepID=UPI003F5C37E5
MVTSLRSWSLRLLVASSMLSTLAAAADDTEGVVRMASPSREGVIRVSDDQRPQQQLRGQSPDGVTQTSYSEAPQVVYGPCPEYEYEEGCYVGNGAFGQWLHMQCEMRRARNQVTSHRLHDCMERDCQEKWRWFRCKFGYFFPTGCCGKGCPPVGHYGIVYPVDPGYFDSRDGQVYAAPGYNGPVSVPLAPVVNHTYNYGWGIPSSRLTPVLHPPQPAQASVIPYPGQSAPVAR